MSQLIAPTIALLGVALSAIVAWIVGTQSTRVELRKKQLDLFQLYAGKLVERRIVIYPDLYQLVSDVVKKGHRGNLRRAEVKEFIERFQAWDSRNSLFLSVRCQHCVRVPVGGRGSRRE